MSLAERLRQLEVAGLIRPAAQPEAEFTFRHALVHQAAYNTYLKSQRRRVHQVIAEVLEEAQADPHQETPQPTDLAYHYFEAGQWDKAMHYARQSGERAQARYAAREALSHFSLALDAARELPSPPPSDLLRARGQAHEVLGDFDRAHADYLAALDQARAVGPWQSQWQLLLDLGFLFAARDYARTGDYCRQALALAQRQGDEAALAHSLNRLGNWHFNVGENLAALDLHQQALTIFQRLHAKAGLAETHDLLGMVQTVIGRMRLGKASYEQAIRLFREQDNRLGLISCLATLAEQGPSIFADTAAFIAPRDEAVAHGRQAVTMAQQIGFRAGEAYALCSLGGVLVSQGDYAVALPDMRAALRIAQEIDHRQWQAFALNVYGLACLDLFQMAEARQHVEHAYAIARQLDSAIWIAGTAAILTLVYLEHGELDRAAAILAHHPSPEQAPSLQERLLACMRAEVALAAGDPQRALDIVRLLIANTPEMEPGQVIPRLWHLRGRALAGVGQVNEGLADVRAARDGSLRHGTLPLVWRQRRDLARLYALAGQTAAAQAERAAAHALVRQLAAGLPDAAWRAHFLQEAAHRIDGKDADPTL